jgi:hypothetical protein
MKRLIKLAGVAMLTLFVGVAITRIYRERSNANAAYTRVGSNVEIEFLQGTDEYSHGRYGKFRVTNTGTETLHYTGYGRNSHCSNMVRQGLDIGMDFLACSCGTGLRDQRLKPGERATFTIRIPRSDQPFEVGFDFFSGEPETRKTFWSNEILQEKAASTNH